MARRDTADTEVIEAGPPVVAAPKLVVPQGRGARGKSVFVRWAAERAVRAGRPVLVADGDRTNATLAAFFQEVTRPPSPDGDAVTAWLSALLDAQTEHRASLLLDLGGGDLVLKEYARDLGLVEFCDGFGIEPVAVHLIGGDLDDLAYLDAVETTGIFAPPRTVLVLNEGVLPPGRSAEPGFAAVRANPVFQAAVARGARVAVMPRLGCMAAVDTARLQFADAESGRAGRGGAPFSPTGRQQVKKWRAAMEAAFAGVSDWLP